jgi:hypothetical protein
MAEGVVLRQFYKEASMEGGYIGSRQLDTYQSGVQYLVNEGILEGSNGIFWNSKTHDDSKYNGNIPEWKWSVMERIAEYLYQKGPTDTRIITRMYGIRTTQFITTMTYYWPIYEDFRGGGTRSYTIGIRTEPHILEIFREKRKRARYEKD